MSPTTGLLPDLEDGPAKRKPETRRSLPFCTIAQTGRFTLPVLRLRFPVSNWRPRTRISFWSNGASSPHDEQLRLLLKMHRIVGSSSTSVPSISTPRRSIDAISHLCLPGRL